MPTQRLPSSRTRRVGASVTMWRFLRRFGRPQIAMRHAHAPAAADAGLGLDDTFLVLAVVVRVELVAGSDGGLEQRIVERVLVRHLRDSQRAAGAAAVGAPVLVALDAREQRRYVLPAPAAGAHLRPGVVVERLAAHPDEAVDGAGAAQNLAARHRDLAIGGAGLGLGFVAPIGGWVVDQQAEADGKARVGMTGASGLHQQHLRALILAQPRRQHRAGRAGADDDVVVCIHVSSPICRVHRPAGVGGKRKPCPAALRKPFTHAGAPGLPVRPASSTLSVGAKACGGTAT